MKTSNNTQTDENEAKEKQSWDVDNWMKVIFNNESRICIGQSDYAATFI